MSAAVASVAIGAVGLYQGFQANKEARRANRSQEAIMGEQLDMASEQWDTYRDKILPLEIEAQKLGVDARELALQRGEIDLKLYDDFYRPVQEKLATMAQEGVRDQTARATRDAAETVSDQFARSREVEQRNLSRMGVRPDSGAYRSNEREYGLAEAAARSDAINTARENELDRVEDANFNRLAVASGRQPVSSSPTQSPGSNKLSPSGSLATIGNVAGNYGNMAQNYAQNAGNIVQGGLQLAGQFYNTFKNPSRLLFSRQAVVPVVASISASTQPQPT